MTRPSWLQRIYLRGFTIHWGATLLDTSGDQVGDPCRQPMLRNFLLNPDDITEEDMALLAKRTGADVACLQGTLFDGVGEWTKHENHFFSLNRLESRKLRVNRSKLEVLVGAAGPDARRINAEIARGAYQFTFRDGTIRASTVVKYLGCQVESQKSTRAETQMRSPRPSRTRLDILVDCGLHAPLD